jgi:hypothetical protein
MAIDAPAAPFLAKIIIEIFSGISPAIGLMITAKTIVETPISTEKDCKDEINGLAPKTMPKVPIKNANAAFVISDLPTIGWCSEET